MPSQNGAQVGKVVTVSGEVSAEAGGGGRVLAIDSPVFQDDILVTEQGERIEVLFNDGTRLAQGENSRLHIDTYVFDSAAPDASSMLLNAAEGTFRTITGKIAAENPENFTIKTPLATLGIRGTTVLSHITPDHEIHGPEFIEEGKAFVLTDNFGNIRFITDHDPVKVIDVWPDEPAGFQRILTEGEFLFFEEQVPLTTPEGEESSEAETGAILAAAAGKGADALFGPDSADTPAWDNTIGVPQLFGPEGLPPLQAPAIDIIPPSMEPPPVAEQARDLLNGIIEDTSHRNNPPIAREMFGVTDEDQPLFGILEASDPDNDPLTYAVVANPEHGTVTVNPDGSYTYQPDANYFGPDGFSYQVADPYGETSSAMVSIQVDPVNDDPVARDATFTTEENQPVSGRLFGYDVDGDPLHFSVSGNPGHGAITINPDGTFTYTPEPGFSGTDTFQFLLSDGQGGFDIGQGIIVVEAGLPPPPANDPPVAGDIFASIDEDQILNGFLNGSDPDGDPLTYSVVANPQHGTLTVNGDGTYSYQPDANYFGTDSFTYQVADPYGETSIAMVSIQVAPVNDAPVADDATFNTGLDQPVSGQLSGSDVEGDPLSFSLDTNPLHGTISINPDGTFTYTPNTAFSGTDTFQFLLSDGQGGFDIGQVVVVVGGGTGPPVAADHIFTAVQGVALTDQLLATDPQGDALTYSLLSPPVFGTVTVNPDGSFTYSTTNNPLEENYGIVSFQYLVDDGQGGQDTGTVTFTVSANYVGDINANAPKAGTALNDIFNGMDGSDTINGAGGNDTIIGGLGDDTLTGGSGSDTFFYNSVNDGYDAITDFTTGTDVLHINGTLGTPVLTASGSGPYDGFIGGSGAAIILHHNILSGTWQVIYDPSIDTAGGSEANIADLGSNPIDSGDVVLG